MRARRQRRFLFFVQVPYQRQEKKRELGSRLTLSDMTLKRLTT